MAEYHTDDPDECYQCPYDNAHMIRGSRMPYHLIACRKSHKTKEMFTCPFNSRHIVPKPESRHHLANCPDKARIEPDLIFKQHEGSSAQIGGLQHVPLSNWKPPHCDEDWDSETTNHEFRWGDSPEDNNWNTQQPEIYRPPPQQQQQQQQLGSWEAPEGNSGGLPRQRMPKETPQVLQQVRAAAVSAKPTNQKPTNTVFNMAVGKAGMGRGTWSQQQNPAPLQNGVRSGYGQKPVANGSINGANYAVPPQAEAPTPQGWCGRGIGRAAIQGGDNMPLAPSLGVGRGMGRGRGAIMATGGRAPAGLQNNASPVFGLAMAGRGQPVVASRAGPPGFVIPRVNSGGDVREASPISDCTDSSEGQASSTSIDPKKEIRKLRKKLKAIETLETKQESGEALNDAEIQKLASKDDFSSQLAALEISGSGDSVEHW